MTFEEYQKKSRKTLINQTPERSFWYSTLGLLGETGEVAEKIKKLFRDDNGVLSESRREEIRNELGDVLWYLSQIATDCDLKLENVAKENIKKIFSRKARQKITGDGDNR